MALSRVQYEQKESGNKNFTVPMPYISRDHIKVSVDGVDVPFSWLNDSTVQLHTAPPLGAIIDVRRETERNVLLVDFQDASTLTEYQLDLAALQSFFLAQEAFDATGGTLAVANDGSYSANNRRISNVGYPNSDGDAANVKYVKDVLVSGKDAFEERLLAEAARNKAQQWADANENVQVESGKYSAKHHAAKAAASASSAAMSAANAENYQNTANSHRLEAANSAAAAASSVTAAANSAAEAMSYRDAADSHRQAAAASAAEAAGYAAGVNLPSALGHAGEYLRQREDESGLEYRTSAQMRADLELGTAATRDVTTSPTDTTEGRVMKVGDGGWLGRASPASYIAGYPTSTAQNVSQVYRREEIDGQVAAYAASIHFAAQDTWGRLRIAYREDARRAWIQGGLATSGSGWTEELYHTGNMPEVTQQEAEAGTGTARRAWTAQRVRQAITAWWAGVFGTGANQVRSNAQNDARFRLQSASVPWDEVSGKPSVVSQAEAQAGTSTTVRMWTAQRVRQAAEAVVSSNVPAMGAVGSVCIIRNHGSSRPNPGATVTHGGGSSNNWRIDVAGSTSDPAISGTWLLTGRIDRYESPPIGTPAGRYLAVRIA